VGRQVPANGTDPCSQATQQGLECVTERGSFGQLRLYNRPAILLLSDGAGTSHQVVLTALDDEQARIELGGARSVASVNCHTLAGRFRHAVAAGQLPGEGAVGRMRGAEVRWLRQSLQRLRAWPLTLRSATC